MTVMTSPLMNRKLQLPTGRGRDLAAAALVGLALLAAYAPNLYALGMIWAAEPNYTYGFLIIPLALWVAWQRRGDLDPSRLAPSAAGWAALAVVLASRFAFYQNAEEWAENATLPAAAAALVLALGGWHLLRWAAAPLVVLTLMLPLPPSINNMVANPLQTLAAVGSEMALQTMGLAVLRQGNTLIIGTEKLEVARACNGLSMLLTFVILVILTVLTVARQRPFPERAVLLLSAIPIALVSNMIRIIATAWAYHIYGHAFGEKIAHTTAGFAMMPLGLFLIWIEITAFQWLIVEDRPTGPNRIYIPIHEPAPRPVKK